jgi:hypothetical protein
VGQAFLPSFDLAPPPLPPPALVRKLVRRCTGRLKKRDNLLAVEGDGVGEEPNIRPQESLLSKNHSIISGHTTLLHIRWHMANKLGWLPIQAHSARTAILSLVKVCRAWLTYHKRSCEHGYFYVLVQYSSCSWALHTF